LGTNLPSLKNASYKTTIIEYRMCTQAQRHQGEVRISPLFIHWLLIQAKRVSADRPISHIYYNNLGLDRFGYDISGMKEKELSLALHQLEKNPLLKIAVITLPASKSLMNEYHYQLTDKNRSYFSVFNELLRVAEKEYHPSGVADFKISPKVRSLLFGSKTNQTKIITSLLQKSFAIMAIKPGELLSLAQKQAVWLHFTKFELTNYIQKTIKPDSFNFSCKDAIDRGALSSVYYHLHNSFSTNQPINRDEFEKGLDIAAANVKGRGMNFHRKIIWNVINTWVNAQYEQLIKDSRTCWLIDWRDINCPSSQINKLLLLRSQQFRQHLDLLPIEHTLIKEKGYKLCSIIQTQQGKCQNNKHILLEIISRSSKLLTYPNAIDNFKTY
ncbi:MAG: hypothetical protein PSV35_08800, partial [bacterium]|nr:hypothetical protein [bacterium]